MSQIPEEIFTALSPKGGNETVGDLLEAALIWISCAQTVLKQAEQKHRTPEEDKILADLQQKTAELSCDMGAAVLEIQFKEK